MAARAKMNVKRFFIDAKMIERAMLVRFKLSLSIQFATNSVATVDTSPKSKEKKEEQFCPPN